MTPVLQYGAIHRSHELGPESRNIIYTSTAIEIVEKLLGI